MKIVNCECCKIEFEIPLKEYNRKIKNGKTRFFCSRYCAGCFYKKPTFKNVILKCLSCNKEFLSTTHKKYKKCCSIKCARKYSQSFVNTENISKSLKKNPKLELRICIMCGRKFQEIYWKKRKTCNTICHKQLIKKNSTLNPNCGGETGYRHYKYKNILMDSSWEVELAKWMDNQKIDWERSRKKHMFWWIDKFGNKRRYYPDFYIPKFKIYLDPKNKYKLKNDLDKLNRVVLQNKINLIFGDVKYIVEKIKKLKI